MSNTPNLPSPWQNPPVLDAVGADGLRILTYRTAPLNPKPPAPPTNPPPGFHWWPEGGPVWSAESTRWTAQFRQILVVNPPPEPPPPPQPPPPGGPLPALTRFVANPAQANRGTPFPTYKVLHQANQSISNVHVEGFNQNVVAQNIDPGGITLDNVRAIGAWSDDARFVGQGVYCENVAGQAVLRNSVFAFNGVPRGKGRTPRMYQHGAYLNAGAKAVVDTCIFAGNANAGVQLRQGGTVRNCIFLDFATAIELVMGDCTIEHCSFLGAHLYFDETNWTAGTAVYAYNPVTMKDLYIVGVAGQCANPGTHAGAQAFPQPALGWGGTWNNGGHPPFKGPAPGAQLMKPTGVVVTGWGAKATAGPVPPGVQVLPKAADPSVLAKGFMVYDDVIANKLSVPAAVTQLHALIRAVH